MIPSPPSSGKKPPKTKYTSKVYSHVHTVSERHVDVHLKYYDTDKVAEKEEQHDEKCIVTDSGDRECYFDKSSDEDYEAAEKLMRRSNNKENVEDNDGEHLPAGQHLLVDIERVNSDFLKFRS